MANNYFNHWEDPSIICLCSQCVHLQKCQPPTPGVDGLWAIKNDSRYEYFKRRLESLRPWIDAAQCKLLKK